MKLFLVYLSTLFLLASFYPQFVFSQSIGKDWNDIAPGCVTPEGVATLNCIPALFDNIIRAALIFSGLVAIALIVFSGYKFIASKGDAKQIEGARNTLTYAIIGLVIVLLAYLIIGLISGVTNVGCITSFGFENCN